MQNDSVNKGIFHLLGTRIWAPMPVYQYEKPSRYVTDSIQINIKMYAIIQFYIYIAIYIFCIFYYSNIFATHTNASHT